MCLRVTNSLWYLKTQRQNFQLTRLVYYLQCHPITDFRIFEDSFCNILIQLENKKQKYIVSGDMNLWLASANFKVKNYFDLLNALGSKFLINLLIQFSKSSKLSLLDHNCSNNIK